MALKSMPAEPVEPESPQEAAQIAADVVDLPELVTVFGPEIVREVLTALEFCGRENGGPCCPLCKAQPALDAANPREWEKHTADCKMAAAIAKA